MLREWKLAPSRAKAQELLAAGAVVKAKLKAAYPPPGQLVDVGEYRLHLTCLGTGAPVVVMEAGAGDAGFVWALVQPRVAEFTTACVYDRDDLDLAFDAIPERTIFDHVDDLRALMAAAGVECPCIWEGWSFGGAFALASALDDPEGTAGLVILDTDFPVVDGTQRCVDLGIPADQCAPDPGDALALTWGQQVAERVAPLPPIDALQARGRSAPVRRA